jgi:hypothetical protein
MCFWNFVHIRICFWNLFRFRICFWNFCSDFEFGVENCVHIWICFFLFQISDLFFIFLKKIKIVFENFGHILNLYLNFFLISNLFLKFLLWFKNCFWIFPDLELVFENFVLIFNWDFYFRVFGSLVVLSFSQLLNFFSVLPKPLSETLTRSSNGSNLV